MGQCCSGHEEAKATELGPPKFGSDIKVRLKKQGYFDADFDVIDISGEAPAMWMLVDAVGGVVVLQPVHEARRDAWVHVAQLFLWAVLQATTTR